MGRITALSFMAIKNQKFIYKNDYPLLRMIKNLKISEEAHKMLCQIGKKEETFDEIIKRLIKNAKNKYNSTKTK